MSTEKELKELFDKAHKNVVKVTGREFISISKIHAKYGIPGYFSTGLPDLDLLLNHNPSRTEYGIPRGRVTEIHGESSSFKSTMCYQVAADCLLQGGQVFWIPTEFDFDDSYARQFIHQLGVPDKVADASFFIRPASDIGAIFDGMKEFLRPLEEYADSCGLDSVHGVMPPILFVIDSIGSLESTKDMDRMDDDFEQGGQTGSYAGEMHRFFHFFLEPLAKLGATLLMTNHYRADLGFGQRKRLPAHESSIRYYASLRMALNAWNYKVGSGNPTRQGLEYAFGKQVSAKVYKIRGELALSGETNLFYQNSHGFDYLQSVVNVLRYTGIATYKKKEYEIAVEDDEILAELNGNYGLKELKDRLAENPERVEIYAKRAMLRGPLKLEDMRSKAGA